MRESGFYEQSRYFTSYDHRNYEKKHIIMRKIFRISDEHGVFAYSDVVPGLPCSNG
jgi:hypothetical protein